MKRMSHLFSRCLTFMGVVTVSAMLLGGCTITQKLTAPTPPPDLTFENLEPLPLAVERITVSNEYDPGRKPRDISQRFPTSPATALETYAQQRLRAESIGGTLNFVIEEASVIEEEVPPQNILEEKLGINRKLQYDMMIRLRMEILSPLGAKDAQSTLTLEKSLTLPRRMAIAKKEDEWLRFLETMMEDVDAAVTQSLRHSLDIVTEEAAAAEGASLETETKNDSGLSPDARPAATSGDSPTTESGFRSPSGPDAGTDEANDRPISIDAPITVDPNF